MIGLAYDTPVSSAAAIAPGDGAGPRPPSAAMTTTLPPWSTQWAAELLQPLSRTTHRLG